MGNFTYLKQDDNKSVASAAVLTSSTADSTYPLANLKNASLSKLFRTTSVSSQYVEIDAGSAVECNLFGLANHNFTSAVTLQVKGGASPNPSTFTQTIDYRKHLAAKLITGTQTFRYWRFTIDDPTNTDGYLEMALLPLGLATTLGFNYEYGWRWLDEYVNLEHESEFGVPFVEELFNRVQMTLMFEPLLNSESTTLRTLYQDLKRNMKTLFWMPDSATADIFYGRLINHLDRTIGFRHRLSLILREDSKGRSIGA